MVDVTTVTTPAAADEGRRAALLERAADYIMERGLAELSLRPLADALATSARMLMYYFGSKERLVVEALQLIAQRERAELSSNSSATDPLRAYWRWISSDQRRPYLRLLYEVYGLALRDPGYYGSFLADEAIDWLRFAEHGFRRTGLTDADARALSTYTLAAMRGLELDLLTTNDIHRANDAFELFHADLERRVSTLAATTEGASS
jgi:AcrR family transcriptional regulator